VDLTFDDDPASGWTTEGYNGIDLGGLKSGVGIVFDLGRPRQVAQVRVRTNLPGWEFELYASDDQNSFEEQLTDTEDESVFVAESSRVIEIEPTERQYFVVWITLLTESEDRFRAEVAEVDFYPPPE
jgi:hypothetical protein